MSYNHQQIDQKWQKYWQEHQTFKVDYQPNKPKYYALDMFPYPSGAGLHVGHPEGYTATDIISRYKRMQGFNVMHPMGWDAFGLPAEQYALKTGNDPRDFTKKNIEIFKKQLQILGLSYDWNREIATCDPKYYKWTQWIFLKLYEKGLVELRDIEVNWCQELGTVLANEEILNIDGKMVSEVGKFPVEKKPMKQWVLKITYYAQRLLDDLDGLDWPESIKEMQRNWIGKSEGAYVDFKIDKFDELNSMNSMNSLNSLNFFTVFTTRPDTLFGATYCVLAPEHQLVKKITTDSQRPLVEQYLELTKAKTDLDRTELNKEKTGVFTGAYAINPVNGKKIPIWIADYVLASYGTGAIMAVPAHDQRDYEFATKFNLEIIPVLKSDQELTDQAMTGDGIHINSGFLDGLNKADAIDKINQFLTDNNLGKKAINYRLRDWIFSRQRYWGEPFPIIHWEDGTISILDQDQLPLELPIVKNIKLSGTGESPLANLTDWLEVVRADGVKGRRETNTMPQWAGSCWYYIGYLLANNGNYLELSDPVVQEMVNYWLPVDLYIGGTEHAVLHLLYSRFWHKVLYDCGVVTSLEPFQRLFNQGIILGENGVKMSKSLGNVVNPDQIVNEYGADALRLFEMFMGPLEAVKPWSSQGVEGARRFLERVYRYYTEVLVIDESDHSLEKVYHQTVKKVTEDYEALHFNTAISQMMIFINECYKAKAIKRAYLEGFLQLLNPIAPHLTEELWQVVAQKETSIAYHPWPTFDPLKVIESQVEIVIQINGKIRDRINVDLDTDPKTVEQLALNTDRIKELLNGLTIRKIICVKNKLVNIVAS